MKTETRGSCIHSKAGFANTCLQSYVAGCTAYLALPSKAHNLFETLRSDRTDVCSIAELRGPSRLCVEIDKARTEVRDQRMSVRSAERVLGRSTFDV